MIRNNRPYTNENGHIDDGLITDCKFYTVMAVSEWIKENLEPAAKPLMRYTSYGLKHMLEKDTGIYLTNNEFKDAMLLAGYRPVDENALNWSYSARFRRAVNPSPFYEWATVKYAEAKDRFGDFANDMRRDETFPAFADREIILSYLKELSACGSAVETFIELWSKYEREADRG